MGLKIITITIWAILNTTALAFGGWQEPVEKISGVWGTGDTNFGIENGETSDRFPSLAAILSNGRIVISDQVNEREVLYNSDGVLIKIVPWFIYQNATKTTNPEYPTYQYWNVQGYTPEGNIWIKIKNYTLKDSSGQIIRTSPTRPLELGLLESKSYKSGSYLHSIRYPDKSYSFILPWESLNAYWRDLAGNIVVAAQTNGKDMVYKINPCGKIMGQMQIPEDKGHVVDQIGPELIGELDYEYGKPIFAPNGDIYAWKRTPDTYSILKWAWVDDPNVSSGPDAPTGLTLMPSTTGLYLTWTASPQDPGCVTGYEVSRATSTGGIGTTVATVNKGVVKYNDATATTGTTYYYKIRAVAGSEYSPYTSEVSGKR